MFVFLVLVPARRPSRRAETRNIVRQPLLSITLEGYSSGKLIGARFFRA
jgi:hypothetical protein